MGGNREGVGEINQLCMKKWFELAIDFQWSINIGHSFMYLTFQIKKNRFEKKNV